LNGAKFSLESKKAEALRVEEERLENDRKQKLFQERRLQIVEYKQFYNSETDLILTTETEQSKFDSLMNDLIFRKTEYLKAQEKLAKENEVLKKQNEKKAQEIKQLKQEAKQTPTPASISEPIQPPAPPIPVTILTRPQTKNEDIIMVNRSEYETLKKRYAIAKTALEAVLYFIVPQNLRDLINKAMIDIKEADEFKETF
jgi:hypothetical protein